MWGNIAVEETVDVTHKGAQLKVNKCSSEQRQALSVPDGQADKVICRGCFALLISDTESLRFRPIIDKRDRSLF